MFSYSFKKTFYSKLDIGVFSDFDVVINNL